VRRCALGLLLFVSAPAQAAELLREFDLGGAYLADRALLFEGRAGASYGGFGIEAWAFRLHDRGFVHPLDALHTTLAVTASSHAEGYVLAGLVGVSYTRASAAGSSYTGPVAPDVGGRFLWDVQPGWRVQLEGRLSMYEDGYGFIGGVAAHKRLTSDVSATLGWRVFWTTQEGSDDVVKNGIMLGLAY